MVPRRSSCWVNVQTNHTYTSLLLYWLAPSTWLVGIYVLGLMPRVPSKPSFFEGWPLDKIIHFFIFVVLAWMFCRRLPRSLLCLVALTVIAITHEMLHLYHPGRDFEWGDMASNLLGVASGVMLSRYYGCNAER
ncbi:MAG: VanZ family protein [Candidatus Methylacidiphilales bacterium]